MPDFHSVGQRAACSPSISSWPALTMEFSAWGATTAALLKIRLRDSLLQWERDHRLYPRPDRFSCTKLARVYVAALGCENGFRARAGVQAAGADGL